MRDDGEGSVNTKTPAPGVWRVWYRLLCAAVFHSAAVFHYCTRDVCVELNLWTIACCLVCGLCLFQCIAISFMNCVEGIVFIVQFEHA